MRLALILIGTMLLLMVSSVHAYVWKCHTPNGDVWTSEPAPSGDCEEYDDVYNPNGVPPGMQGSPPQVPPQMAPPPPPYIGTYLPAPYYYNPGYYYGPGVYFVPPAFGYRYGGYYGRHYGGHHRR